MHLDEPVRDRNRLGLCDNDSEPMDLDDDEMKLIDVSETDCDELTSAAFCANNFDPNLQFKVEWRYFELLNDLQKSEGLRAANKISNKHTF